MTGQMTKAVQDVVHETGAGPLSVPLRVKITPSPQREHGDFCCQAAMPLAKILRIAPLALAELIKAKLDAAGRMEGVLLKAETVAPGYINLFIDWFAWAGRGFDPPKKSATQAVVEHTSINPNKSAHVGHLRNACIGDTLVRMLRRNGTKVEVHNYIDDLGNQLADTVAGLLHTPLIGIYRRFGDYCWDLYAAVNREYASDPGLTDRRVQVLHELEKGDGNVAWVGALAAERIVREHVEEMERFGIDYDLLVWESRIVREGLWEQAFGLLRQSAGFLREDEGPLAGCWVLKRITGSVDETPKAVEHLADKVLVRSNGILTYTAKDIAYHLWKFGLLEGDFLYKPFRGELWTTAAEGEKQPRRRADLVVNVIDHRQQYPQHMVKEALTALGFEEQALRLKHVSYGVVSLSRDAATELGIDTADGRSSYPMSGRQGIGIKVNDLLARVEAVIEGGRADQQGLSSSCIAAAAIRYYLLRFHLQTEVVFDLRQATEISGNTGVYLLYAYARAVNVLNKADGIVDDIPVRLQTLEPAEHALLRQISCWPDVLYEACEALAPHQICAFAYELAAGFHTFYAECPILKAEAEVRELRLWLSARFRQTLGDALQVLGLPTPARL
ncbi:arginine--tRNA ligase [Paenibacillus athensensis]|nr:arginine--tRNA ligase [Paenibacillus athensensis]MCD1258140.1 arginine--tRNA ligase [Paenibacillus athensensis]